MLFLSREVWNAKEKQIKVMISIWNYAECISNVKIPHNLQNSLKTLNRHVGVEKVQRYWNDVKRNMNTKWI